MSSSGRDQTLGEHVKAQREAALLTVTEAAKRAGLSRTAWEKVEGDKPVRPITLRRVAGALGKPPRRFLELAGFSYVEADDEGTSVSALDELRRRIEALEPLPIELAALRAEVRELVTTVRSVHHGTPGT